jgi:hypothetical protein
MPKAAVSFALLGLCLCTSAYLCSDNATCGPEVESRIGEVVRAVHLCGVRVRPQISGGVEMARSHPAEVELSALTLSRVCSQI